LTAEPACSPGWLAFCGSCSWVARAAQHPLQPTGQPGEILTRMKLSPGCPAAELHRYAAWCSISIADIAIKEL